jgi:hypothetical protein
MGPSDVRYFLKYPLVNTWMYETAFGPLGKNHRTYARVDGRPLIFRELMQPSPINNFIPLCFLTLFRRPQAASVCLVCFVSVYEVFVRFRVFVGRNSRIFASMR